MPKSGNLINPVAFAAICAAIAALPAALLVVVISLFVGASAGDAGSALGGGLGGIMFAILLVILYPVGTVVGTFISAGIYHVLTLLYWRQRHAGFGATLRAVSYASFLSITSFLLFIPILNILWGLVMGIYSVVLLVLGIREAHATTTGISLLIVLTLPVLGLVLSIVLSSILGAVMAVSVGP